MADFSYNTGVVNRKVDHGTTGIARGLSKSDRRLTMDHSTLPLFARKVCIACGDSKPLSEFHKGNGNDGLRFACKACTNAQNRGIYYENRDAHLEAKRRYREQNPDNRRATLKKHTENHLMQRRAHYAVNRAIANGKLLPACECACAHCGVQAETLHHWSYEREHWLDVIPLCRACHGKEHRAYDQ